MKTKYSLIVAVAMFSLPLAAQETYQDTKFVDNDLNGTARYVGMGGAMEALGADISTISTGWFSACAMAASRSDSEGMAFWRKRVETTSRHISPASTKSTTAAAS